MKNKFNIIFMGTPDFAVPALKALAEYDCNISLVITQPDRPKGRGKKMVAPPVKIAAMELGLDIIQTESMNCEKVKETLIRLKPDLFVVVAFGHKLSRDILSIPSVFPINIHASLLPKYRGSSPIQAAILNMDNKTGVTTMVMDENLDTGDILLKAETPIRCDTTASELHDTLAQMGADLIIKTLDAIYADEISPVPQNDELASFAPLLNKNDGRINWNKTSGEINALVRATTPWPGAFTFLNGKRIKIFKLACADKKFVHDKPIFIDKSVSSDSSVVSAYNSDHSDFLPGTILSCGSNGINVAAGNSEYVTILELQAEGCKRLEVCEFLKGKRFETGTRFDN